MSAVLENARMFETIAVALLPSVITVILGFVAAKRHDFVAADASVLIKMVMHYALPLALFVGTVHTTRVSLLHDVPLLVGLFVAMVALYVVVLIVGRLVFHASWGASALGALAASAPNFAYIGPPVLGNLYGQASSVPIAVGNTLLVLTVFPATVVLLTLDARSRADTGQQGDGQAPGAGSDVAGILSILGHAVAQPIVWMPLLAVALVMLGVQIPAPAANTLDLLGQSATGVALFSAGIVIAAYKVEISRAAIALAFLKNIGQPALVLAVLLALGYTNPLLGEAVVATALPAIVSVALLGVQYDVAQSLTASMLFLSLISSLATLGLFIALTGA
jgi:malonate transporter